MRAPHILAIDTATEVCSVAVLRNGVCTEHVETVGQKHSERALPMIDAVLAESGLSLSDIDVFAFGAGPGSFTGLRVACGIVQGLAYGKRKRVVAIGNLRALAAHAFGASSSAPGARLLAAIDARMNEVYCAIYRRDDALSELLAPSVTVPDALAELAQRESVELVAGNALRVFANAWPRDARWQALPDATPTAADIARLAHIDDARGLAVAPAHAAPLYVRDRVAMTVEQRKAHHAAKEARAEVQS